MASPFGPLLLIADPRAGRGRVAAELPEIERQLLARRLEYRIVETRSPGDGTRLAGEALRAGGRFLVAVGDDRVICEVAAGMLLPDGPVDAEAVLGLVGAGSGSDFVRTFGLPDDAVRAVRHLTGDRLYPIDAVRVDHRMDGEDASRFMINAAQVGMGALHTARTARLPKALGRTRSFVAFWSALSGFRPQEVHIGADRKGFTGTATTVVVANCQFARGGMKLSPRSYPGDGLIDVQVHTGPRSEAFTLLPKMYRGEHVPHPHMKELRGRVVSVEGDRPLPLEVDGLEAGTTPATFTVLPQAIRLKI